MYTWLALSIIGGGISIAIMIFILEWMFPEDVHLINYSLTDKTFKELYSNHNYHSAIFLAEGDTSYINDDPWNLPNKDMLRDCYMHVGEYSKAEKIGKEFLAIDHDLSDVPKDKKKFAKLALDVTHAVAARDLFRLYEKMGDREKQLQMYKKLQRYYKANNLNDIEKVIEVEGYEMPYKGTEHSDVFSIANNLKYDLICGLYLENPDAAIDSLCAYINDVWTVPSYKPTLKLTLINRLLSWYIERNELFKAQSVLINGIDLVKTIVREDELEPLGEFAEYCYILHDYKNARRFMNVYMRFMEKYYSDDDLDYLLAEIRFVKYQDKDIDYKIERLSHCCEGIKEQISKNFAGITAEQQEYFAKKLDEPFAYALNLLDKYSTNDKLIELCFENEVFKRGLLMRSDALVRQAILNAKDSALQADYNLYLMYKRELIAREDIVGPGNFARRLYLKNEVSKIESSLSTKVAEFSRNNYTISDKSSLMTSLGNDRTFILYTETPRNNHKELGVFVLNKENGLVYKFLGDYERKLRFDSNDITSICTTPNTYTVLLSKVEGVIGKTNKVLYSPAGLVNRIPLASLSIDNNLVAGDKFSMQVIANPMEMPSSKKEKDFDIHNQYIALWGGIDYGQSNSIEETDIVKTRAVLRGQSLEQLKGSIIEVNTISDLLTNDVKNLKCYTGVYATERNFKTLSSKANIIHISTHGFFKEDFDHEMSSAMHNSGLFFANANRAWKDEFKPEKFDKNYEDGILRAEEIENLNLASCNLVILSACETGLGEINGSEGVYGLQRAFKLAGTKYILMSLWPVPDLATSELMKRFYSNLLKTNDIVKAFSDAQYSMRHDQYHIYNVKEWGGFVLLQ